MKKTTHKTWNVTRAAARAAFEALVVQFRPLYLAEVARLAETLRPKFESGELRGYTDEDDDARVGQAVPMDRLEDLCNEHFGLQAPGTFEGGIVDRDPVTAELVLAASPSAEDVINDGNRGHARSTLAMFAAARDVLAFAIARGWRKPRSDEEWTPGLAAILKMAQEVRS
jgi:hypothetical protein